MTEVKCDEVVRWNIGASEGYFLFFVLEDFGCGLNVRGSFFQVVTAIDETRCFFRSLFF